MLLLLLLPPPQRDSRYSQGLIDMMQRLDNAMREGRSVGDLAKKVDDSLKQETMAFFAKVAASNARKWTQSVQKCQHDTEHLLHEAKDKGLYNPNAVPMKKTKYTARDLDVEDARLETDYNRNWLRHEGFHLQEAFRSQQQKLDREWDLYTEQLHDAVNAKKKSILGNNYALYLETQKHRAKSTDRDTVDERFHHPEKQKSLIHTAPVISPKLDNGKPSRSAAGSAMRAVRGKEDAAVQAELVKLDKQLAESMASLEAQKVHASKWMHQQNVRIVVQAEENAACRLPMSDFLSLQLTMLKALNSMS
jgi:hypothetical protein